MDWLRRLAGQEEPEPSPQSEQISAITPPKTSSDREVNKHGDYIEIGSDPVPGITLKRILRGQTDDIEHNYISWSRDGQYLAIASSDNIIHIWNVVREQRVALLEGHTDVIMAVVWSPDGRRLASCSHDRTIRIWHSKTWKNVAVLRGHEQRINHVAWSPDSTRLVSCSWDGVLMLWNTKTQTRLRVFEGHPQTIARVAWPLRQWFASASENIRIWDSETGEQIKVLEGHLGLNYCVEWIPNRRLLASGFNQNIELWDIQSGKTIHILEGHTSQITGLGLSADGLLLASKAGDGSVRVWRADIWETVAVLKEMSGQGFPGPAFHPYLPILATLGENDTVIRIWDINTDVLLGQASTDSVRYTTARLVLVGDSGVGKTGLGWRLAHGAFKEHSSTHGQQFWVVDDLCTTRSDGTECEAVLWDLAGQHVYRQIHSIFLDDVDASLVLFDPTNRQDPLKGTEFWLEQLKGKGQLPPSVLVGARMDRGGSTVSEEYLAQFCQRHGISGGYIATSAKEGLGVDQLIEILKAQILWDAMTTTVTTVTFKRIKDYVLALKEAPDRQGVLVQPAELRQRLQETDPDWQFTDAEMITAVGHLQTHGYVTLLKSSSGETHILLTPDLLVDLASSIVLLADKHPRELGAVSETELLEDRYAFAELAGLTETERRILLDAAVLRFMEHNVCFRETFGKDTLLIFPGLIKQKRPLVDDFPAADDVSYVVRGRVENLYAMLVVLLGYTPSFIRINQWQNQAQYEMGDREICGFRLIEDREGEIELVLYYSERMPQNGREMFQELFERFLYQHDVDVTRFPPVLCPRGHQLDRATIINRVREGKAFAFCAECGDKVGLPDLDRHEIGIAPSGWLQREEAAARLRSMYETHLTRVKGHRRDRVAPRCCLSHTPDEAAYAEKLKHDLQEAGIYVVGDPTQVKPDDYVVVLDTSSYQEAWGHPTPEFKADMTLVQARLGDDDNKRRLIAIALTGKSDPTPAHDLKHCDPGDFSNATHYPVSLFNLVLNLYAIPFDHMGFAPLRESLHQQWEATLGKLPPEEKPDMRPLKVFISYAHKDESFKDELVVMLTSMQRRGIIDAWQDRRIEAGDEWFPAIQAAMNECDLALLLVSKHFLASRFIQGEEVPHLLQRRKEEGMRVIPIIISPCLWNSEPILKDLQALPQDGKAVITFSEDTGARDQVWTDIAKELERRAKELQTGA